MKKTTSKALEKIAITLAKEKGEFAFHSLKNIQRQLKVLSKLSGQEGLTVEHQDSLEQSIWVYHLAHYYNYANPIDGATLLMKEWKEDFVAKEAVMDLLNSFYTSEEKTAIQKIYYDSLTSFWATKNLKKRLLEQKNDDANNNLVETDETWLNNKQKEMEAHSFLSNAGQQLLATKKLDNQTAFYKIGKDLEKEKDKFLLKELQINPEDLKQLKKKLQKLEGRPERGVETMFRLASRNLYTRAKILDSKSSILLTVNSIILSVVLGTLYTQIQDDPLLIFPVITLFITNLSSIAFAIIATRPIFQKGEFTRQDVMDKKASLLNFDDYNAVSMEEYQWAMDYVTSDAKYLYHTIVWDLHKMGIRMHAKYKNLRIAYNIFLYGLILSIFLFIACQCALPWI